MTKYTIPSVALINGWGISGFLLSCSFRSVIEDLSSFILNPEKNPNWLNNFKSDQPSCNKNIIRNHLQTWPSNAPGSLLKCPNISVYDIYQSLNIINVMQTLCVSGQDTWDTNVCALTKATKRKLLRGRLRKSGSEGKRIPFASGYDVKSAWPNCGKLGWKRVG